MVYCFSTCTASIRTIPVLQHDPARPEDLDTLSEDHCFASGTMVETDQGPMRIEQVPASGRVLSIGGYQRYRSARRTRRNADIMRLGFDSGAVVYCTKDHKFLVDFDDWRYAKDLIGMEVLCVRPSSAARSRSLMESATTFAADIFSAKESGFISRYGSIIADLCRKVITSITRTMIGPIIGLATSNASRASSILAAGMGRRVAFVAGEASPKLARLPLPGMALSRGALGIPNTSISTFGRRWRNEFRPSARSAAKIISLLPQERRKVSSAGQIARRARCVSVEEAGKADVYCLTVPATGCFAIEGGILVSNCADDWRYACSSRPWTRTIKEPEAPKDGYGTLKDDLDHVQSSVKLL
jgi:hypothetical protein